MSTLTAGSCRSPASAPPSATASSKAPSKSAASRRTIALDRHTTTVLRNHRTGQQARHAVTLRRWRPDGYVVTRTDGLPYHPNYFTLPTPVSDQPGAGLPPVRLHDLRHGAASLAHAAGADLKSVQDQLRHASIVLTADAYTSVLPANQHKAAEATARLVLHAARTARAATTAKNTRPGDNPQRSPTEQTPN